MKNTRWLVLALASTLAACSHAPKKTTPELGKLEGKKVALVEVDGEATPKKIVEVALVNQLVQNGTFILVSREDVEASRARPNQSPTDWQGIARGAGADFALRAKVKEFDATTREGYSSEQVEDSAMEAEQGKGHGTTEHIYKVKSMEGKVGVQLDFTDLKSGETRSALAESQDKAVAEAKDSAAHLPPKLRFLERIANEAFRKFFESYK